MLRGVLAIIIAVVFLVVIVGPIAFVTLMHLTSGPTRSEKAGQRRAQELYDIAKQRQESGYPRDPATASERSVLLDRMAPLHPPHNPFTPARREIFDHLTPAELEELINL